MSANDERDLAFERDIRAAYDKMDPSPQAEQRMLAALKAAHEEKRAATRDSAGTANPAGGKAADGQPAGESTSPKPPALEPVKTARKRIAPWKVALPAAACLVLIAIGIGLVAGQPPQTVLPETPVPAKAENADEADGSQGTPQAANTYAKGNAADSTLIAAEAEATDGYTDGAADGMRTLGVQGIAFDVPEDFNTEEYGAVEETGFVSTATSPLSTVSADVDTASYANLRRLLTDGAALSDIPAGAVRIEEMLNYFDYAYPSPAGDERFSLTAKTGPCPWNKDTQLLVLGFATAPEVQDKPANLVFLIDVSGSMDSPEKLELLQDSFATLLGHLDSEDRVSIVTYSGQEEVVLEGAKGDDEKAILRAIYRLHADGSTNGEAGLKMAYEVAQRNFIEGGVNRIVMASDGDLNVGMTSESDLHDFVSKKRDSGIYLSVLGFGSGNYKDTKMETLADNGNGQYHYIDSIQEADRVLSEKLMSSVVPFADDVKLQVEFNPAQVKGYRLIGYENRAMAAEDFRDDTKDAGDIGPNAQFTVAYELALVGSAQDVAATDLKYSQAPAGSGDEWATATLRYRAIDDGQVHEQQLVVTGDEGTDADWKAAAAVIEFGMLARDSEYVGTATLDGALSLLDDAKPGTQFAGLRDLIKLAGSNRPVGMDYGDMQERE